MLWENIILSILSVKFFIADELSDPSVGFQCEYKEIANARVFKCESVFFLFYIFLVKKHWEIFVIFRLAPMRQILSILYFEFIIVRKSLFHISSASW